MPLSILQSWTTTTNPVFESHNEFVFKGTNHAGSNYHREEDPWLPFPGGTWTIRRCLFCFSFIFILLYLKEVLHQESREIRGIAVSAVEHDFRGFNPFLPP
jgi:hypothetical protein